MRPPNNDLNDKRYYGKECPHGHTLRYKSTKQCVTCSREAAAKYARENPERIRKISDRYAAKHPGKAAKRTRDWRAANRERQKEEHRKLALAHFGEGVKLTVFPGSPCKVCGSNMRYISSGACRDCQLKWHKKEREKINKYPRKPTSAEKQALALELSNVYYAERGESPPERGAVYPSPPCGKCGCEYRYVYRMQCVDCTKAIYKRHREKRREQAS